MKKWLIVLLLLTVLVGNVFAQDEAGEQTVHEIVERAYPFYIGSLDSYWTEDFPLYFMDGVYDLPYVELRSWANVLAGLYNSFLGDEKYGLTITWDGTDAAYVRENDYRMDFDFEADTITFDDYNAFIHDSKDSSLLDILSLSGFNEAGESILFQRNMASSYDRYGDVLRINLKNYGIELIAQDGQYYIPLQTMSDLLISPGLLSTMLFNGKNLIMANATQLGSVRAGLTPLGELYYAGQPGERSAALAEFGYRELCLAMDYLYGLKDAHDITNFDQLFWQIGVDQTLRSTNAKTADSALYEIIDFQLDDLHSTFREYSYLVGAEQVEWHTGPANKKLDDAVDTYMNAREAYYPDGYLNYEEIGNTAFITFDEFEMTRSGEEYYKLWEEDNLPNDTIGLILYAHYKINREGSPIENVVIDLSNNTGGDVDAAIFIMSWFLGDAPFSVKNTMTGALTTATYRADVNLDHQFDAKDTVADKNLYCLISPVSFSCGNLVPAVFKNSEKVTLLGRTSGGGSCAVQPLSTAWGTVFQLSGPSRFSFLKNGSFYDIDQGVEPDYTISKPAKYFDREALVEYINNNLY